MNRCIKAGVKTTFPLVIVSIFLFFYICIAGFFDTQIDSSHNFIHWFYLASGIAGVVLVFALIYFIMGYIDEKKTPVQENKKDH